MRGGYLFSLGAIGATPILIHAWMPERRVIRVTFSVAPKALNSQDADDVLNSSNWTVAPIAPVSDDPMPYTTVEVVSVRPYEEDLTGTEFDVTLDVDPTFGITYAVGVGSLSAASNPLGLLGSPSSLNVQAFDPSYRERNIIPMIRWFGRATRDLDGPNRDNAKTLSLIDEIVNQVSSVIEGMQQLFDPLRCPKRYLDKWLAALGNPFTEISATMSEVQKRRLCLALVDIYRYKGTAKGITDAIQLFLGLASSVHAVNQEFWQLDSSFLGKPLRDPADAAHPQTQAIVGTCVLGSSPNYIHSVLGPDETTETVWLDGGWTLRRGDEGRPLHDPALELLTNVTYASEGREGIYSFAIVVSTRAITAIERTQIATIANYMKPVGTKLRAVYDPYVNPPDHWLLDISALDTTETTLL